MLSSQTSIRFRSQSSTFELTTSGYFLVLRGSNEVMLTQCGQQIPLPDILAVNGIEFMHD